MRDYVRVPSTSEIARTYYERPFFNRITGRYTVAWGDEKIRAHKRFQDFEGHWPSLYSIVCLPRILGAYLLTRRHPLLKRPLPFLCADAVRFLTSITQPNMRVLELGGGNSTLWFLGRGMEVTTVEHSREWAALILRRVTTSADSDFRKRLQIHVKEGDEAIAFIKSVRDQWFDVILVDCANEHTPRSLCVAAARSKVRKGGWLVLDDSDAPANWVGVNAMSDRSRKRFTGYPYMGLTVCQTSFWQM